jgi:hypothetical protein
MIGTHLPKTGSEAVSEFQGAGSSGGVRDLKWTKIKADWWSFVEMITVTTASKVGGDELLWLTVSPNGHRQS